MSEKAKKIEIRCLKDKAFFDLMKKETPTDCAHTIKEQIATEELVKSMYIDFMSNRADDPDLPQLNRETHVKFLLKGLGNLPSSFEMLDASHPWICYWILHALYLLNAKLSDEMIDRCQCPNTSAFGGGPGQLAHLAPTYAAVNALCTLNCTRALKIIDQEKLAKWIRSLRMSDGAMQMHEDGEEDLRGAYCAISVAKLCNLESIDPHLFDGVAEWIASCQTYEGGFGATPFNEAHGGYSYCGLAALKLLGKEHLCDIDRLTRWLVNKQMSFEGGFQGRTNKLVDSCYSFWQAGMFPIIQTILAKDSDYLQESDNWLFDRASLQEYILICCQTTHGGIIDKPGKSRDYYHTCYALSGLSISQYYSDNILNICSSDDSLINKTHPLFNICFEGAFNSINHFSTKKDSDDLEDIEK